MPTKRLTKHDRVVIDLSLQLLEPATKVTERGPFTTPAVRLALRCLLPFVAEKWPLVSYWKAADQTVETNRVAGCTAALNGIVRQLGL